MRSRLLRQTIPAIGLIVLLGAGFVWRLAAQEIELPADGSSRVIAISDIHGAYDEFVSLLKAAGLVDSELEWRGGNSRLVIVGDVVDRGPQARRALDLIMQLEQEAAKVDGKVYFVLGNHEIMNLAGDLRYVTDEEFAAYREYENADERDLAHQRFLLANQDRYPDVQTVTDAFEREFPPGFFGHRAAYSRNGRYGKWLLNKPVILMLEDTVFAHAGLAPALIGVAPDRINSRSHTELDNFLRYREQLLDAGLIYPETGFMEQARNAQQKLELRSQNGDLPEDGGLLEITRRLDQLLLISDLFGDGGITWYRGNVACNPAIEETRLAQALEAVGARRLVIGHTPNSQGRVLERFDGRLIRADTGMLASYYGGKPAAVVIERGDVSVIYPDQPGITRPEPQPRRVANPFTNLNDDELALLLQSAPVLAQEPAVEGRVAVTLDMGGNQVEAVFIPARMSRGRLPFIPEVAAYRLDRLLQIDMIPVAVVRELDGRPGALMLATGQLPDEQHRFEQYLGASAWCPLADQFGLMYVLDALLGNQGRTRDEMRYDPETWQLILTGNDAVLGNEKRLPRYLDGTEFAIPSALRHRLESLIADQIEAELGTVLGAAGRQALLARRDLLLKRVAEEESSP